MPDIQGRNRNPSASGPRIVYSSGTLIIYNYQQSISSSLNLIIIFIHLWHMLHSYSRCTHLMIYADWWRNDWRWATAILDSLNDQTTEYMPRHRLITIISECTISTTVFSAVCLRKTDSAVLESMLCIHLYQIRGRSILRVPPMIDSIASHRL